MSTAVVADGGVAAGVRGHEAAENRDIVGAAAAAADGGDNVERLVLVSTTASDGPEAVVLAGSDAPETLVLDLDDLDLRSIFDTFTHLLTKSLFLCFFLGLALAMVSDARALHSAEAVGGDGVSARTADDRDPPSAPVRAPKGDTI
jgi:hypothetical protein